MNTRFVAKQLRAMADELDAKMLNDDGQISEEMVDVIWHHYNTFPWDIDTYWSDELEEMRNDILKELNDVFSFLNSVKSFPDRDFILYPLYKELKVNSLAQIEKRLGEVKKVWENRVTGGNDQSIDKLIEMKFGKDIYAFRDFMNNHCKNPNIIFAIDDEKLKYVDDRGRGPEIYYFASSELELPEFADALKALKE